MQSRKKQNDFQNYEFYLNCAEQIGIKVIRKQTKNGCFRFSEWKMKTRFQSLRFDLQRYHTSAKEEISLRLPHISKECGIVLCNAFCQKAKLLEKILSDWE